MLIENIDNLKDAQSDIAEQGKNPEAFGKRWERQVTKAHAAGLEPCEICGNGIKNPGNKTMVAGYAVGPECVKKLRALGYTW